MNDIKSDKSILTGEIDIEAAIKLVSEEEELYSKLKSGIGKIGSKFMSGLKRSMVGDAELDEDLFDEIEEKLLIADIGVHTTRQIINHLQDEYEKSRITTRDQAFDLLKKILAGVLMTHQGKIEYVSDGPTVLMFIGVNGSGKTTSIGKLAAQYVEQGKKTLVVAGDTFRAAAVEQLEVWCKRSGADFFSKGTGSDPSATMYEASRKAVDEKYDILICDTSGRLHTNDNLMKELSKMKRVISKNIPDGPHHTILVLDSNSGQNAVMQAKIFKEAIGYEGLVLTKLDGTAKGGVIFGIVNEYKVPVYYVGLGESIKDLYPFDAKSFIKSFFGDI